MIDDQLLKELNTVPEIAQALELTKESAGTRTELEAYEKYWDTIRTEKTLIADAESKGRQEGELKKQTEIVLSCFNNDLSIILISNITQLSEEEVISILKEAGKTV